jgi:hypothetical protein
MFLSKRCRSSFIHCLDLLYSLSFCFIPDPLFLCNTGSFFPSDLFNLFSSQRFRPLSLSHFLLR